MTMTTQAQTGKCKHCRNPIWLTTAGWVHTNSDALRCPEKDNWGRPREHITWAIPRLSASQDLVLRNLLPWEWRDAERIQLVTDQPIKGIRNTLVSLIKKGLVERKISPLHGRTLYRRSQP